MILDRIIRAYTNTNDTVLDCFSGSGSTMIAAFNSGRKFIGSEISEDYCNRSRKRFNELAQATLPV